LDGIDDLLLKLKRKKKIILKSFLSNKTKSFLNKISVLKRIIKNHYKFKTNIFYLRYANNIVFYGLNNKKIFVLLKNEIIKFLTIRGLNLKLLANNLFQFKPNSTFSFLGFRYIFPSKFQKKNIKKGRFAKKKYTIFNIIYNCFSTNLRTRIFIIIDQNVYKVFKYQIHNIFKKKYFYLTVVQLISILNKKIADFALYFSYAKTIKTQLNKLDNSIRRWF
jgi:hypothetical protein